MTTTHSNIRAYRLLALLAGSIMVADQLTKAVILKTMQLHESIPVVDGFFSITYIRNPGAAFGLFAQAADGIRTAFFLAVTILALIFLWRIFATLPPSARIGRWAVSMVAGGALGNMIDRLRFGEVVDFLDFYVGSTHWPAFNVADSSITVGVGLLIWHFFRQEGPPEENSRPASTAHDS